MRIIIILTVLVLTFLSCSSYPKIRSALKNNQGVYIIPYNINKSFSDLTSFVTSPDLAFNIRELNTNKLITKEITISYSTGGSFTFKRNGFLSVSNLNEGRYILESYYFLTRNGVSITLDGEKIKSDGTNPIKTNFSFEIQEGMITISNYNLNYWIEPTDIEAKVRNEKNKKTDKKNDLHSYFTPLNKDEKNKITKMLTEYFPKEIILPFEEKSQPKNKKNKLNTTIAHARIKGSNIDIRLQKSHKIDI